MLASHYKPKKIAEINFEKDNKIALVGKVLDQLENSFVLEDETGNIEIFFEGKVRKGQIVRVFCSVIESQVRADIVQSLEGLDLEFFKKVEEMYRKAGLNI
ncbi:MAG: hypothetical protein NZ942_03120 [Candidatus Aenigmarchaeota archaeon]|nr:hypothetical protein [Candidatus Aenigmarchaeota archaeon]